MVPDSADLAATLSTTRAGDRAAVTALGDRLAALGHAELAEARVVLCALARRPRLLLALDAGARGGYRSDPAGWAAIAARNFRRRRSGLLAAALASLNRDGHVREAAVAELLARGGAEALPFVALRTVDWVMQVRDRARAGLALALSGGRASEFMAVLLPTAARLGLRQRGDFVTGQVVAALWSMPAVELLRLMHHTEPGRGRGLVFDVGIGAGSFHEKDLMAIALGDRDWRTRVRAAELVARDATWSRRPKPLRELVGSTTPAVRVLGLIGLDRLGASFPIEPCLSDSAPLVRAFARSVLLRRATDPAEYYREHLATAQPSTPPAPGVLAGLGECGTKADAMILSAWLTHPQAAGRQEAVRALVRLGGLPKKRAVALLTDPSTAVVRQAAFALRGMADGLDVPPLQELLEHNDRPVVRRAAYTILRETTGWPRLRAALTAAADSDARLSLQGVLDASWWARQDEYDRVPARDYHRAVRERPLPPLTRENHAVLVRLTQSAAPRMSAYAVEKLRQRVEAHLPEEPGGEERGGSRWRREGSC